MLRLTHQWNPKINRAQPPPPPTTLWKPAPPLHPRYNTQRYHPSLCLGLWSICLSGGYEGRGLCGMERCLCGGTRTVIKDSTAARAWFACLIICHMLHGAAISHIRAPALQRASLRLEEAAGERAPRRSSSSSSARCVWTPFNTFLSFPTRWTVAPKKSTQIQIKKEYGPFNLGFNSPGGCLELF